MSFDHKNYALVGLFPGLVTTTSVANLGTTSISVSITPIVDYGGGSIYHPAGSRNNKYKVKIIISRNGKTWEYERIVGETTAKVIAKVTGQKVTSPTIKLNSISMVEQSSPIIKVKLK